MASFINLLANDVWSDADMLNRTEAMIRSEFPDQAVAILNRKATGALLGQYRLTDEEKAELQRYAEASDEARQALAAAQADMARLTLALDFEAARARLALPEVSDDERAAAQAIVDGASDDTLDLVALRNPVPEVEPIVEAAE
jgi:hypothetical protein